MLNKAVMNGATFHKGFVVLQRLMDSFSNRLLLVYCCLGILLFSLYQFQINPDGVSYLNIAHLYAIGDFHDAINGFWGPLISWLLVPLILLKLQPLFAYKIVSLTISFFTFIAIRKLSYRFAINEEVRLLILIAAIPMLLFYAFLLVTPDLVLLCITLYYFYYIFDADYSKKATQGFIIGFLGALLYFSKSYGFYFFIAHFSLFTFIYLLKSKNHQERRNVLLKYIFGLTIFLIISGIWIYSLSNKYQHFTVSISGEYNMKLDSLGSEGQPVHYQGLLPLSYPAAVSAWDDPSYLTIDYEKSPRLVDQIAFQIVHFGENVLQTFYYLELFSVLSMVIVLLYAIRYFGKRFRQAEEGSQSAEGGFWSRQLQNILAVGVFLLGTTFLWMTPVFLLKGSSATSAIWIVAQVLAFAAIIGFAIAAWGIFKSTGWCEPVAIVYDRSRDDGKLHSSIFYSLITILLYTGGYELLHIETRFLWIDAILLLLLCANYAYNIHFDFVRNATLRRFIFLIIFFSFCLYPIMQLIIHVNQDRDIYLTAKQLQTVYHLKGNLASNDDGSDGWDLTLFYTYFLDSKYYGAIQKQITDEELYREIGKYHIDYFFMWNSACRLSECRKIAEFQVEFLWTYEKKHLIVYQIINNGS